MTSLTCAYMKSVLETTVGQEHQVHLKVITQLVTISYSLPKQSHFNA